MLPSVSIIVLNYNGKHFLYGCLSSLSQINYPSSRYEVILVDNGSTDGSVEYLREKFPWVKILVLDKNYGFTGGNNKGAKVANGELLVFLNNDTIVDKNWLHELIRVIVNEKVDVCGSRIFFINQPNAVQYAGGYLHLIGGAIFEPLHKDKSDQSYYFVGSICGASFAIRKHVFQDLGDFDDDFFLYADEGDLCLRAWIYGYSVGYAPQSIAYHYGGGTSSREGHSKPQSNNVLYARLISPTDIYYGNRNSIALLIKNFQLKNLLPGLIFSYLYLLLQLILLLRNKRGEVKLLIKAGAWPLWNLKTIWKKRVMIQRKRKISDGWLVRKGLLLSIGKTLRLVIKLRYYSNNIKQ